MKKEFAPYEPSLALKELGFDEPNYFLKWYDSKGDIREGLGLGEVKAPLYQQAFRWFREKYGYTQYVREVKKDMYRFCIENFDEKSYNSEIYNSYEEAELACLIKLIEIVKNK